MSTTFSPDFEANSRFLEVFQMALSKLDHLYGAALAERSLNVPRALLFESFSLPGCSESNSFSSRSSRSLRKRHHEIPHISHLLKENVWKYHGNSLYLLYFELKTGPL